MQSKGATWILFKECSLPIPSFQRRESRMTVGQNALTRCDRLAWIFP